MRKRGRTEEGHGTMLLLLENEESRLHLVQKRQGEGDGE